jgi:hypothetical protein
VKTCCQLEKKKTFVTQALAQEVESGFMVGPLDCLPWEQSRVSPLGVATGRYSGKKRLILDLSSPHDKEGVLSINDHIDKTKFSLEYTTVDDAIRIIKQLGKKTGLCKFDIKTAFRILPIRPKQWKYHCVLWDNKFYVFVRLTFGSRSSPRIFTYLSEAIHFIATHNYGIKHLLFLLDDFLCLTKPGGDAGKDKQTMLSVFNNLGIPLNEKKTEGVTFCLQYLGIELDTLTMEARLPPEKVQRIISVLKHFLTLKRCTKQQLLSLLGHLSFAAKVVIGGRTFVARLIELSTCIKGLHDFINISQESKEDVWMWLTLLTNWNGVSVFHDNEFITNNDLALYTDSSSSVGFGAFNQAKDQFVADTWINHPVPVSDRAMSYLELYPIVASAVLWGKGWKGKRIVFFVRQ